MVRGVNHLEVIIYINYLSESKDKQILTPFLDHFTNWVLNEVKKQFDKVLTDLGVERIVTVGETGEVVGLGTPEIQPVINIS